jgi:Xaa-Pro aminopeptidase
MDYEGRQGRAAAVMQQKRLDAMMVMHLPNVQYLCGFSGSAGVLAAAGDRWAFFTDGRYTEQSHQEVKGARITIAKGSALAAAAKWISKIGVTTTGIEAEHISVSIRSALKGLMPSKMRLRETSGLVEQLRVIKEPEEIKRIREAVALGNLLLDPALKALRPGVREVEVAAKIEYRARTCGASGMSFETIIAGGARSALPHGCASGAPIPRNGFVVMDFGVILANYCSDMTRTVHVGRLSSVDRHLYEAVREAQMAAVNSVAPGVEIGKVDQAARQVLNRAGLAKYFTHSTGHGVGLEIHEPPRIARAVKDRLEPGMVVTIEPGAYVPGHGGARIEDMVLVTASGCEVLTQAPKELIVL